jgi:hypothetical protein
VVNIAEVDESTGFSAGALRQAAIGAGLDPPPSGVDAIVAADANLRARSDEVRIITSDRGDFELLASLSDRTPGVCRSCSHDQLLDTPRRLSPWPRSGTSGTHAASGSILAVPASVWHPRSRGRAVAVLTPCSRNRHDSAIPDVTQGEAVGEKG